MKPALRAVLVLLAAVICSLPAGAFAHNRPHRPRVSFTKWTVKVSRKGVKASYSAAPGATVRICSSKKLVELDAHYKATGLKSGTRVHQVWRVTGKAATSSRGRLFRRGYFYIANSHGLRHATWRVRIAHKGKTLGRSLIKVRSKRC